MQITLNNMRRALVVAVTAATAFIAPVALHAQDQASATITGQVLDPTGASIPNVTVSASSPALQLAAVRAVTDSGGNYTLVNLPAPGVYRVTFEGQGFGRVV